MITFSEFFKKHIDMIKVGKFSFPIYIDTGTEKLCPFCGKELMWKSEEPSIFSDTLNCSCKEWKEAAVKVEELEKDVEKVEKALEDKISSTLNPLREKMSKTFISSFEKVAKEYLKDEYEDSLNILELEVDSCKAANAQGTFLKTVFDNSKEKD